MTINMADFDFDGLSRDERIELASALLKSAVDSPELPALSEAMKSELARRIEAYKRNPHDVLPWEEVRAEIYASIGK